MESSDRPAPRIAARITPVDSSACGAQSAVAVTDLWARRAASGSYQSGDEVVSIQSLEWLSPTVIGYRADVHSESACRQSDAYPIRSLTGRLDVENLSFIGVKPTARGEPGNASPK